MDPCFLPNFQLTAFGDRVQYFDVGVMPCMLLRLYHHASTPFKGISEYLLPIDYSTLTLCLAKTRLGSSSRQWRGHLQAHGSVPT